MENRYRIAMVLGDGSLATLSRSRDDPQGLTREQAEQRVQDLEREARRAGTKPNAYDFLLL